MAQVDSYVPFASRPGWEDLKPIKQDDAVNCLVPIAYTEKYRDAMDTFRSLVSTSEKSARGLELTEHLIRMNPGHYSIWNYRSKILLETKADLSKELDLMDELIKEHLKSYQVWQHRRTVVQALGDPSRELPFTTRALSFDSKNYHTWAYRQWVLLQFFPANEEVWEGEQRYADDLVGRDIRNNSAWTHRFFVRFESGLWESRLKDVAEEEIEYAKEKLAISPNNPSAWNYLRGILKRTSTPLSSLIDFVRPFTISPPSSGSGSSFESEKEGESEVVENAGGPTLPAPLAIEFLADALVESGKGEEREEAIALYTTLTQLDPIRLRYWKYRVSQVQGPAPKA
ncbi:protein prenylyltransferase [Meredithblackwellia eburnea MCA 4105]